MKKLVRNLTDIPPPDTDLITVYRRKFTLKERMMGKFNEFFGKFRFKGREC